MRRSTMDDYYRQPAPLQLPPIPRWLVFIAVMVLLVLIFFASLGVIWILKGLPGLFYRQSFIYLPRI